MPPELGCDREGTACTAALGKVRARHGLPECPRWSAGYTVLESQRRRPNIFVVGSISVDGVVVFSVLFFFMMLLRFHIALT